MRKSLYLYRASHAKLTAEDHPTEYFYAQFRLRCTENLSPQGLNFIIKEMGEKVGLPPCLMARLILKSFINSYPSMNFDNETITNEEESIIEAENDNLTSCNSTGMNANKNAKIDTARVTKILRDPESIESFDPILSQNIKYCLENDFLTSPSTDQFRQKIGMEWENFMHGRLKEINVLFYSEVEMRAAGYPKTPDALLAYPVEVNGHIVNWIESKALFSDLPAHQTYLRDQYWPYYNRFGPGLVIYWFGFLEDINGDRERERGILVMDRFPDEINKIVL